LYPSVDRLREVSALIAVAVITQAAAEGKSKLPDGDVAEYVKTAMWEPVYPEYVAADS